MKNHSTTYKIISAFCLAVIIFMSSLLAYMLVVDCAFLFDYNYIESFQEKTTFKNIRKQQMHPKEKHYNVEAKMFPWAHSIGKCYITFYDTCKKCCGKSDGITYRGLLAAPYETFAVDTSVIPLGSNVFVDYGDGEVYSYIANDTGSKIIGNRVDVCVSSHSEAVSLGRKTATVYWN